MPRDQGRRVPDGQEPLPVVVAVGAGAAAGDAVVWAAAEAASREAPLRVVHAVPPRLVVDPYGLMPPVTAPPMPGAVAAELVAVALDRAATVAPDLPVSGSVLTGAPARLLVEQSKDAALLVLGGRDRTGPHAGPADVLYGRVAVRASCPVVLVRARPRSPGVPAVPSVVVGIDATGSCVPAVDFAFRAASQRGVPLTALHTWSPDAPADLEGACGAAAVIAAEATEELDRVLDRWCTRVPDVPVQRRVVRGDPAAALVAASRGAALVVLGCRGRGPVQSRLFGSVSRRVARDALAPVAVVGVRCDERRTARPARRR